MSRREPLDVYDWIMAVVVGVLILATLGAYAGLLIGCRGVHPCAPAPSADTLVCPDLDGDTRPCRSSGEAVRCCGGGLPECGK